MPDGPVRTSNTFPSFAQPTISIRKAGMGDIPSLLALINAYAQRGIMLPRTEFEMAENIRDFSVIQLNEKAGGCGALHLYTSLTGEIRSLAVAPDCQGLGAGRKLMDALLAEAQAFGLKSVFAFTYIPGFFAKLGFKEIGRDELPLKAWKDCLRCPKFQCCDEIAVVKPLPQPAQGLSDTPICGDTELPSIGQPRDVVLPILRSPH